MKQLLLPLLAMAAAALSACSASPGVAAKPSATQSADLSALAAQYGTAACPSTDPAAEAVEGGLPQTSLPCLDGEGTVNLAGLPREPMIINLWAQWCAPCRAESPFLKEAYEDLAGVTFLGINYDDPQPDWAIELASLVGWDYPHVVDQERSLRTKLTIAGLPTTLFVDAEGVVAGVHAGQLESTQQLLDLTTKYLGVS